MASFHSGAHASPVTGNWEGTPILSVLGGGTLEIRPALSQFPGLPIPGRDSERVVWRVGVVPVRGHWDGGRGR